MDPTLQKILIGTAVDGRAFLLTVLFFANWLLAMYMAWKLGEFHWDQVMDWFVKDIGIKLGVWYLVTVVIAYATALATPEAKSLVESFNTMLPNIGFAGLAIQAVGQMYGKYQAIQGDPKAVADQRAKAHAKRYGAAAVPDRPPHGHRESRVERKVL